MDSSTLYNTAQRCTICHEWADLKSTQWCDLCFWLLWQYELCAWTPGEDKGRYVLSMLHGMYPRTEKEPSHVH